MALSSPKRDEVWLVPLYPSQSSEIQKTRPCVIVSPDEANEALRTVIVAPMTTTERLYPTRVSLSFQGKRGQIALDQMRAVDRRRLTRRLGRIPTATALAVSAILVEMFTREARG
jgi:mRNA interferase MazF